MSYPDSFANLICYFCDPVSESWGTDGPPTGIEQSNYLRPVFTLKNSLKVGTGEGTAESPYNLVQ